MSLAALSLFLGARWLRLILSLTLFAKLKSDGTRSSATPLGGEKEPRCWRILSFRSEEARRTVNVRSSLFLSLSLSLKLGSFLLEKLACYLVLCTWKVARSSSLIFSLAYVSLSYKENGETFRRLVVHPIRVFPGYLHIHVRFQGITREQVFQCRRVFNTEQNGKRAGRISPALFSSLSPSLARERHTRT